MNNDTHTKSFVERLRLRVGLLLVPFSCCVFTQGESIN